MIPGDYQMSEQLQFSTLAVVITVAICAVLGFKALLWDEWTAAWTQDDTNAEIADAADGLYAGRDQHASDARDSMRALRGVKP